MLTRIIVAVVLAPLFFWVLLAPPTLCLALLMSAICALASYELLKATQVAHHNLMYVFTALAAVIVPLGYWSGYGSLVTRAVALVLMSALFFVAILRYDEEKPLGLEQVMVCMFGGLLIPMFLSSLVVLLLFCHVKKISFLAFADLGVHGLFIGQLIGRWGNFMNVEAYGGPTTLPWRMCGESIAQNMLDQAAQECQTMKQAARSHLEQAAELIVEKVVNG